jgi:hypothetical protein
VLHAARTYVYANASQVNSAGIADGLNDVGIDLELARPGGNVREFAPAGDFGLAPQSLGWRWRQESNAGAGDGNSVFIEHDDRKAARSLLAMREQQQKSEHRG